MGEIICRKIDTKEHIDANIHKITSDRETRLILLNKMISNMKKSQISFGDDKL